MGQVDCFWELAVGGWELSRRALSATLRPVPGRFAGRFEDFRGDEAVLERRQAIYLARAAHDSRQM